MQRTEHVVNGIFAYRFRGPEPTHALLVLHGMGGHGGIYDVFCEAYARDGAEVWSIDLPGHGRSVNGRRGSFSAEAWVKATVGYAEHIAASTGLPVIAKGSSLGVFPASAALGESEHIAAAVLMGYAIAGHPKNLTSPFRSDPGQQILRQYGELSTFKIERLVDFDVDYGFAGAAEEKRRDPLNTWEFDLSSFATLFTYDPPVAPADNTKPVLFTVGELDPLAPPHRVQEAASYMGGPVKVYVHPQGVHQLMLFHTAEYCAVVHDFAAETFNR